MGTAEVIALGSLAIGIVTIATILWFERQRRWREGVRIDFWFEFYDIKKWLGKKQEREVPSILIVLNKGGKPISVRLVCFVDEGLNSPLRGGAVLGDEYSEDSKPNNYGFVDGVRILPDEERTFHDIPSVHIHEGKCPQKIVLIDTQGCWYCKALYVTPEGTLRTVARKPVRVKRKFNEPFTNTPLVI